MNANGSKGRWIAALVIVVVAGMALVWLLRSERDDRLTEIEALADTVGPRSGVLPGGVTAPPPEEVPAPGPDERDVEIFRLTLESARVERLDTLPIGEIVARIGRSFVGAPYIPGTLEVPGPERLVVNLRTFDCVTFVENAVVLARMIRAGSDDLATYMRELERIRYRDGALNGYASRLHYFSEWIADNERRGTLREITTELSGVPTDEPIDFMTRNASSYPKLADPANLEAVGAVERLLNSRPRYFIPQDRIAAAVSGVRNGDVIAATSSVWGLDVAHTGIAIWVEGRLHLMHAPLVGRSVEISELPLSDRILGINGQDGIMVARPL